MSVKGISGAIGRGPPPDQELRNIHAYWRAFNYLAAGMIYLRDNPLLNEPLKLEHIKNRLLGHWGASPELAFTYTHRNRGINKHDLNAIFLAGPGHGAGGAGSRLSERDLFGDLPGQKRGRGGHATLLQFPFPGGIGSHCTPETLGSIHKGGE